MWRGVFVLGEFDAMPHKSGAKVGRVGEIALSLSGGEDSPSENSFTLSVDGGLRVSSFETITSFTTYTLQAGLAI